MHDARMMKVLAVAGVTLVVLAVVAAVLIVLWPGTGPSAPPSQAPVAASTPSPLTINGEVVLDVPFGSVTAGDWPNCKGTESYADLVSGAQVVVTDAAGKTIGLGRLDAGVRRERGCVFFFKVSGVPAGGEFYGVEVAGRGRVQYTAAQLTYPIRQTISD